MLSSHNVSPYYRHYYSMAIATLLAGCKRRHMNCKEGPGLASYPGLFRKRKKEENGLGITVDTYAWNSVAQCAVCAM